ncbi:MAG TPA: hypothetical protein PLP33_16215 [Leptospiraceae bacterium]|nr:hypothetical protein [Leptospiraceae bacterium]
MKTFSLKNPSELYEEIIRIANTQEFEKKINELKEKEAEFQSWSKDKNFLFLKEPFVEFYIYFSDGLYGDYDDNSMLSTKYSVLTREGIEERVYGLNVKGLFNFRIIDGGNGYELKSNSFTQETRPTEFKLMFIDKHVWVM